MENIPWLVGFVVAALILAKIFSVFPFRPKRSNLTYREVMQDGSVREIPNPHPYGSREAFHELQLQRNIAMYRQQTGKEPSEEERYIAMMHATGYVQTGLTYRDYLRDFGPATHTRRTAIERAQKRKLKPLQPTRPRRSVARP